MTQTDNQYDDHHDGRSDATPGGYATERRPGERAFTIFLLVASLALLWNAYGISGFKKLSSPGTVPMATTAVMVITALMILKSTWKLPQVQGETIRKDIFPPVVIAFVALLAVFAAALKSLGFIIAAALFLIFGIRMLTTRGWGYSIGISLGSLFVIWLVFRIIFRVLMPEGVFPEAEMIQFFRNLFGGAA